MSLVLSSARYKSLTREEYDRMDKGYAAIPLKKKKRKKTVRTWSAGSLAKKDSVGNVNSSASTSYGGKWNAEYNRKKNSLRISAKSVAMLLKRFYGLALDTDFGNYNRPLKKSSVERESSHMVKKLDRERGGDIGENTVFRPEIIPLAILLRKLYGYVLMKSMTELFNKVSWRPREAVKAEED